MRWSCLAAIAAVVLGAMLLAPNVRAADPLWNYTHPDAKVLIGIDWQRAKSSPAGQMIRRQLQATALPPVAAGKGLELFDSVQRILISAPGELSGNTGESPVLIALEGRLNPAALRKSMIPGTAVERFRGHDLLIPPRGQKQDLIACLVSDTLTLLGDRPSIELALAEPSGLRDGALRDRAQQMAFQSEIWMIADAPPMKSAPGDAANPLAAGLNDLKTMDFGLSLAKGLGLRMNLEFPDAAAAQQMALGAQVLTSMMVGGPSTPPELAKIARALQVEQVGAKLKMTLDIPIDVLEKGVIQAKSGFAESGPAAIEGLLGIRPAPGPVAGVRAPAAPPVPREPVKRTIRIVGAEGGDKEITYTSGGSLP